MGTWPDATPRVRLEPQTDLIEKSTHVYCCDGTTGWIVVIVVEDSEIGLLPCGGIGRIGGLTGLCNLSVRPNCKSDHDAPAHHLLVCSSYL